MKNLVRWIVVAAAVLVVVSALGGVAGVRFDSLRDTASAVVETDDGEQSAAQISYAEFRLAEVGTSPDSLRARVGDPEATSRHTVEGLEIECWLYGAAGSTGGYQFCFADGRLRAKFVFAPAS